MSNITVNKNGFYTVDSLYQWDLNEYLYIYGVNVSDPEIHFTTDNMSKSLVYQPTVDNNGVIKVQIPNSILQKTAPVMVYICGYEGSTFKTYYKIKIPIKPRTKPGDYTLENSNEVYSFVALEKQIKDLEKAFNLDEALTLYHYTYNSNKTELTEATRNATVKNYLGLVSTSLKAIKFLTDKFKEFFNSIFERITNLEKQDEILNTKIETYKKPWNVDENIGYICNNSTSFDINVPNDIDSNTDRSAENYTRIPIINSGQIYLDFCHYFENSSAEYDYCEAEIYLNENKITTIDLSAEMVSSSRKASHRILLEVNQGDILTLKVRVKSAKWKSNGVDVYISDITLNANIDTAYTYLQLGDYESISPQDILNALTGGNE